MSRMSDLDYMVREEGARTAEDFIRLGIGPDTAHSMAEVVARIGTGAASTPITLVCPCIDCVEEIEADRAKLRGALAAQSTTTVVFVIDEPQGDFDYWEDER